VDDLDTVSDADVEAEVDPFRTHLIDEDWLVFYRKVWWQNRRYVQGFVVGFQEFMGETLNTSLRNSSLPEDASYQLFYKAERLDLGDSFGMGSRPLLLHSSALPVPLSDFHLALTVAALPASPGYQVVNFLALVLSVVFTGGFLSIYRLTVSQMELAQKKSDFVSAVSHELKTPLTAIRMYGEMLMEGWVEGEKRERYYKHIYDESERLSRLIQNVLTLSELERKEWRVNLELQNPVEFLTGLLEGLTGRIQQAGVEIQQIVEGTPRPILMDKDGLTQILINFLDNAIKYSEGAQDRRVLVIISQVGTECTFRVRDFGPGIPRRELKHIFERFYRVNNEMTRATHGTGLGLSLVKMLADAMGARVDVTNKDPGAEFSIRFLSRAGD